MTLAESTASRLRIPQQPQRQDSLTDQLHDLHILAVRVGCCDAADWLSTHTHEQRSTKER